MIDRRGFLSAGAGLCLACGVGSARAQTGGARRETAIGGKRVRTIDIHCHCAIPEAADYLRGTPLEKRAAATVASAMNNPPVEKRLAIMDAQGIDVEALSVNPYWYSLDAERARKLCDIQNEKLADFCKARPDRFVAFATVALQHPELAAEQLEQGVKHLGLRGAAIGCNVGGAELSDKKFDPFWAKAVELDALIFMHPQDSDVATGITRRVEGNGALRNVIGNPLETTIALSHLIFEGTLDRFPKLKLCAAHGGGYLPSYADRSDNGCSTLKAECEGRPQPQKRATDYLKDLYVDSLVFTPEALRHLAAVVGPRHIMVGTDYGFPWVKDPIGQVLETPGLSDDDKRAILGLTAANLLKLDA